MALSKNKVLHKESDGFNLTWDAKNIFVGLYEKQLQEAPLPGFDVEIGVKLPKLPINIFAGLFYFSKHKQKTVSGPSTRLSIKINNYLNLGAEYFYDNSRGHQCYGGLALKYSFGNVKKQSPFLLDSKMPQLPLRDVDVVVSVKTIRLLYRM